MEVLRKAGADSEKFKHRERKEHGARSFFRLSRAVKPQGFSVIRAFSYLFAPEIFWQKIVDSRKYWMHPVTVW